MSTAIVKGSLADLAKTTGQSIAESFLSAKAIVVVDVSLSMEACDSGPMQKEQRYKLACNELARLQNDMPGQIAVVAFSSRVEFCPGGYPPFFREGTDLAAALRFVQRADGCGIRIIIISDGEPNSPDQALQVARKFKSRIDTIFIGPEKHPGQEFLKKLSDLSGGIAATQNYKDLNKLADTAKGLLNG